MNRHVVYGFFISLTVILSIMACSSEKTIIDEMRLLEDGQSISFKLDPGRYKLELTASNDGAKVEWIGSPCQASGQVNDYTVICELARVGQLKISNPTVLGLGAASTVTIKLTRIK